MKNVLIIVVIIAIIAIGFKVYKEKKMIGTPSSSQSASVAPKTVPIESPGFRKTADQPQQPR